MTTKPEPDDDTITIELEPDLGPTPTEPVETDSNEEPAADATGDSDDERPDETKPCQIVAKGAVRAIEKSRRGVSAAATWPLWSPQ